MKKRSSRGRQQRLKNARIRRYVTARLKRRWSPEQIAGRLPTDIGETISPEAIYQFIYAQIHREGSGSSKQEAQQEAARAALKKLEGEAGH
jgi:transposase, IS30 family